MTDESGLSAAMDDTPPEPPAAQDMRVVLPPVVNPLGIGDVTSDAKGSGARYNFGKPDLSLIPLRHIAAAHASSANTKEQDDAVAALYALGRWQEGGDESDLLAALRCLGDGWAECAQVFDYGKRKYAAWNWAKGMAWSIPLACAARHIKNGDHGILAGEMLDVESGYPHRGHVYCNVVMLLTFMRTFPEGDDRPPRSLFHAEAA